MGKIPAGPTKLVVGGTLGIGFTILAFYAAGWKLGALLTFFLLYEAWTFFNPYEHDTISEVVWALSDRPMVPWVFGVACGAGLAAGVFGEPKAAILCAACFFLQGHFFFQRHE